MLASFFSFRCFFALQDVLHERALVGRKALSASEQVEKRVAMFQKQLGKLLGGFRNREPSCMIRVGATRAVTKQNRRERSRPIWLPKESFETQLPSRNHDCIGNKGCRLFSSQPHRHQCKQEGQRSESQRLSLNHRLDSDLFGDTNVFGFSEEPQRF